MNINLHKLKSVEVSGVDHPRSHRRRWWRPCYACLSESITVRVAIRVARVTVRVAIRVAVRVAIIKIEWWLGVA